MWRIWCGSVLSWCGLANLVVQKEPPLHQPLENLNNNLKLRRHISSKPVGADSDDSDAQQDDSSTSSSITGEFIQRRKLKTSRIVNLSDPSAVPPTRPVTVQPARAPIHRPDLAKSQGSPSDSGALINTYAHYKQDNLSDQDEEDDSASTISTTSTIPSPLSRSGSIRRSTGSLHRMKRLTKSANDVHMHAHLRRGMSSSRTSLSSFDDGSAASSIYSLSSNAMSSDAGSLYSDRLLSDTASIYSQSLEDVLQEEDEEEEDGQGSIQRELQSDSTDYSLLDASLNQTRKSLNASTISLASSTQAGRRLRKPHPQFLTPEQAASPHSQGRSTPSPKKPSSTLPRNTKLK
ncbi:unnamed protein product, partial [Meganyctiphanes norvegica]